MLHPLSSTVISVHYLNGFYPLSSRELSRVLPPWCIRSAVQLRGAQAPAARPAAAHVTQGASVPPRDAPTPRCCAVRGAIRSRRTTRRGVCCRCAGGDGRQSSPQPQRTASCARPCDSGPSASPCSRDGRTRERTCLVVGDAEPCSREPWIRRTLLARSPLAACGRVCTGESHQPSCAMLVARDTLRCQSHAPFECVRRCTVRVQAASAALIAHTRGQLPHATRPKAAVPPCSLRRADPNTDACVFRVRTTAHARAPLHPVACARPLAGTATSATSTM